MPDGVIAEVVDGFATLDFVDGAQRGPALARLLDIGGPGSIQTLTREGPRRKYRVPEGNASEAGLLDEPGGWIPRGDSGYADTLAHAHREQADNPAGPTAPTSTNTFVGQTSFDEARDTTHVATTVVGGPGVGVTHPPPHAQVIAAVNTAQRGPVEAAGTPEIPEGEPSEAWKRDELDAYARTRGLDTADLPNKTAVLDAIRRQGSPNRVTR